MAAAGSTMDYADCLRCGVPGSSIVCSAGHAICDGCLATYLLGAKKHAGSGDEFVGFCPADECWDVVTRAPVVPPPSAKLRQLPDDSPDYIRIATEFARTLGKAKIQNIYVVHNPGLWAIWKSAQASLRHQKRDADSKQLYHGTWRASAGAIARSGVDIRMSGTANGEALGKGFYVAPSASTSHDYTVPDVNGGRCMIYARVLIGLVGNARDKDMPDSFGGGWAYAVRREHQVYPEFVIYYTVS